MNYKILKNYIYEYQTLEDFLQEDPSIEKVIKLFCITSNRVKMYSRQVLMVIGSEEVHVEYKLLGEEI